MGNSEKSDHPDLLNFEFQLREIIDELQWKTDALKNTQEQLLQSRNLLHDLETALEEERRSSVETRMQLEAATEIVNRWEAEGIRTRTEQAQLQINHEIIQMEHSSLMDRVKIVDLENLKLKQRVEELEANVTSRDSVNKELQKVLIELRDRATRVNATANKNMIRLQQEHESLQKSVGTVVQLNKRLQATRMIVDAVERTYKIKIHELQSKLSSLQTVNESTVTANSTENRETQELHLQMAATLKELKLKLKSEDEIEKKIDAILRDSAHLEDVKEPNNNKQDSATVN